MTDIIRFAFEGQQVRTVRGEDGEPWFVLADILTILGVTRRPSAVVERLDSDGVRQADPMPDALGRPQTPLIISEPNLWRVILRSDAPAAEPVQTWVTTEVLPTLRRTGTYSTAPAPTEDEIVLQALQITSRRVEELTAEVVELTPRAQAWDVMASAHGDLAVDEAAKILSRDPGIEIGRNRLFSLMNNMGWVYRVRADRRRWHAYQYAVTSGRLVQKLGGAFLNSRTGEMEVAAPTIRVTPKGLADLREALNGELEAS